MVPVCDSISHLIGGISVAYAQAPERKTTIIVPYTEYEWWLINWSDNTVRCRMLTSHDGLPTLDEVGAYCGQELVNEWQTPSPAILEDR